MCTGYTSRKEFETARASGTCPSALRPLTCNMDSYTIELCLIHIFQIHETGIRI